MDHATDTAGSRTALAGRVLRDTIVGVLMAGCALALAASTLSPIRVDVAGKERLLPVASTVDDLVRDGSLTNERGNLLSVRGAVLQRGGGLLPSYFVDGDVASTSTILSDGAHVGSAPGADAVEATQSTVTTEAPGVVYRGSGPVESIESQGLPAYMRIVSGVVSGEEVTRTLLTPGAPMVIRREPAWAGAKRVALTFDDGPWPVSTDAILSELNGAGVKATFFLVGNRVEREADLVRREVASGMEIGNHSWSHRYLSRALPSVVRSEISRCNDAIRAVTGAKPLWYRPAGGLTNPFVYTIATNLGNRVVLWSVDPKDWARPGAARIARRVLDHVKPGAVILMHDGGGDRSQTVAALRVILAGLKARGYEAVTLSELYAGR